MKKITLSFICALCFLALAACGDKADQDLKDARKVFDQYCAASIKGDIAKLVELTSQKYRDEYTKQQPITDPDIIAMGKAYSGKSRYEILSMDRMGTSIVFKTTISAPDADQIAQLVESRIVESEIAEFTTQAELQNYLACAIKHILDNETIDLVAHNLYVEMVQENKKWKVNFPINQQSIM